MARMPDAHWLGEHAPVQSDGSRKAIARYDIVCIHTIVGNAPAHAAHFSTHHDGHIDQSRDTKYQSGANLDGNPRIIAIENEDHGSAYGSWNVNDGHAVPAFTAAQIEAIAQICAWTHKTHGIPLVACPDSKPGSRGIAYHRQGIDGNWSGYAYGGRVSGGEVWTNSTGKVCPGDRRISQTLNEIIPRAREIVEGDMPLTADEINDIVNKVWAEPLKIPGTEDTLTAGGHLRSAYGNSVTLMTEVGVLKANQDLIMQHLTQGTEITLDAIKQASAEGAEIGATKALAAGIDVQVTVDDQENPA